MMMMMMMEANRRMEEDEEEEEIWSWGAGTEGQLGTLSPQDQLLPQFLPSLSSSSAPFSLISCGGAHVIALTPSGRVLTWGRGASGQLGHGEMCNSLQPKLLEFLQTSVIINASAGWNHSAFVSDGGCLFTCGDGSFGQLGHGDYASHSSPLKVSHFASGHVQQVACGMRHSLALFKGNLGRGQVFGFGFGKRGQLGISTDKIKSVSLPQITFGLEDVQIVSISANGDHSAALSANGHLYTWGRGFNGTSDEYQPHCAIASLPITQVALGWNHALLLTDDGEVFMLGGNHHGVLSNPTKTNLHMLGGKSNEALIHGITGLDGIKILQIDAGAEHSALVTENGSIMTWGWGEHGQLGVGNTNDQSIPQLVNLGRETKERTTSKVYCGSGFTYAVRTRRPPSQACSTQ
ncbi:hypothetical protein LguiB_024874 [Lonicera macranthoides]